MDNVSQAILDLKGDCLTILDKLEQSQAGNGADSEVIAGIPTINEIVAQLDRLFDDIKNLVTDSENNVMSSVEILGEAIKNLSEESKSAKTDRERLVADVAEIKARLDNGIATKESAPTPVVVPAVSDTVVEELHARLDAIEANQQVILDAIEKLVQNSVAPAPAVATDNAKDDEILAEIKQLREQIFAISIASVNDGENTEYESYNSLILNEVCDLADTVSEIKEALDGDTSTDSSDEIKEELSALKADITAALEKNNDNESVIEELNKIKEEFAKKPTPEPVVQEKKAIPPKKAKRTLMPVTIPTKKKKSVSAVGKDGGVSDLLKKIGNTDSVLDED